MKDEEARTALTKLRMRFFQWRENNKGKRIPADFWEEATQLARILGVGRVSGQLSLFYPTLKRRAEGKLRRTQAKKARSPNMSFLEVPLDIPTPAISKTDEPRLIFRFKSWLGLVKLEWV